MGFEVTRFVGKIDEEFICVICTLVLENPVQSSCEHIFCNECINEWLAKDETCPVCRKAVSKEVKPVARYFRNLLNKFDIKCDFESRGCEIVLKLEDLKEHIASRCAYNPNTEIVCDKGCNITISRQEYEANNCFSHLSKALKQLKDAQEEQTKIVNSLRWQICYNMNISVSEPNILEYGQWNDKGALALVQSIRPLTLDHASFKIEILTGGEDNIIAIGLTSKGYPINKQPGWLDGSIGYHGDDGNLFNASGGGEAFGPTWKSGDIIECGLKFPTDDTVPSSFFRSKSIMPVEVYFSINGRMLGTRPVKIPELGFFPTVGLRSKGGKVRYYDS